jgi:hypothetical protein
MAQCQLQQLHACGCEISLKASDIDLSLGPATVQNFSVECHWSTRADPEKP